MKSWKWASKRMTVLIAVCCPHCQSREVVRYGKSTNGKQRFRCLEVECPYQTFSLKSAYPGRSRVVKQQIVEMTLNGSGVRDIARVLHISTSTVIRELKKTPLPQTSQSEAIKPTATTASRGNSLQGRS